MKTLKTNWTLVSNTPNYICTVTGYRAVYKRTGREGYAEYKIFTPDRKLWGVGGLPTHIGI